MSTVLTQTEQEELDELYRYEPDTEAWWNK